MMSIAVTLFLLAATAGQDSLKLTPADERQVVDRCVGAENRNRSMSELTPQQRTALIACAQDVTARTLRAQLPLRIDEITTLEEIEVDGATLIYHNRLNLDAADLQDTARPAIEQATRAHVCGQANMVQTIGFGGAYGYVWVDRTGNLVHRMTISTC
jgi:hypothetical protein